MNFLNLANAGLQTLSTALVAGGGYLVFQDSKLLEGFGLIVAGLACYIIYELLPTKNNEGK